MLPLFFIIFICSLDYLTASYETEHMKKADIRKVLNEAQRCINHALQNVTKPKSIDRNAVVLDLNAAFGLIQTIKGLR